MYAIEYVMESRQIEMYDTARKKFSVGFLFVFRCLNGNVLRDVSIRGKIHFGKS